MGLSTHWQRNEENEWGARPSAKSVSLTLTSVEASARPGVLPKPLAPEGWSEGSISRFGPDNLYEKINGREGLYKGFGFRELTFASLAADDDPTLAIDIELYDLGEPINAVGCYAAERQPDAETELTEVGLQHVARNGLFMTRGKYYVRDRPR